MAQAPNRRRWNRKTVTSVLLAYAFIMTAVVSIVLRVRQNTLREFDTPEARAQWQAWRDAEPNQPDHGPVRRRPPSSTEPPVLVLMRDHFPVVISAAIVFGSLLFGAIALTTLGAFAKSGDPEREKPRAAP